jgi:ZipA, C-terminal FtsZ-binding domain
MSELQLWLIVAGLVLLVGVFAFNKWQERLLQRKSEASFGSRHEDVLLGGGPRLPAGGSVEGTGSAEFAASDGSFEHTLGLPTGRDATAGADLNPGVPPERGSGPVLDERVDFIAMLNFDAPHLGDEILRNSDVLEGRLTKLMGWEGLDPISGELAALSPSVYYKTVRVGLQLVDRAGPASEHELTAFCQGLQGLAVNLVGEAQFGSRVEALKRSEQLDLFCADVDIQIGLSVVRPDGAMIPGSKIRAIAESVGCILDSDGRFRKLAEGGAELYSIGNMEPRPFHADALNTLTTRGVTVLLDVPRCPPDGASFSAFGEFAHRAARVLEGTLVDDNQQPIGGGAMNAIATQVAGVRARMAEEGFPAGSPLALRLFS